MVQAIHGRKIVPTIKALDAVRRCPDVYRYVLVAKAQKYVDARYHFGKGPRQRTKKRERFSRRAD